MEKPNKTFKIADHLFVDCQGYSHHGILVGADKVIHFDSTMRRKLMAPVNGEPPRIREVSLAEFSANREIHVRTYDLEDISPAQVVERAQSRVGEYGYHLFDNNCEHFAVWCKTGRSHSTQVESAQKIAKTGAAGVALSSAVFRSARFLPLPYRVAAYTASAALAIGSTTYHLVYEKRKNRVNKVS